MATVLKISDAASLALHTMVLLADRRERPLTTKEIASTFKGVRGAPGEGAAAAGEGRTGAVRAGTARRVPSRATALSRRRCCRSTRRSRGR